MSVFGFTPKRLLAGLMMVVVGGCVSRPPTIAHVHIGHALTGVHVTPGHKGYLLVAEQRAADVLAAVQLSERDATLGALQQHVAQAVASTDSEADFGLKQSLTLAANHISFAATSADASVNVQRSAPIFADSIPAVIQRCDTIVLLGKDVAATNSMSDAKVLAAEIYTLADDNVRGADSKGDGVRGATPSDFGMAQMRAQLEAMIARERPPYRTVDDWYLFNLVRLPNGRWVFDKLSRGGNIDGYK